MTPAEFKIRYPVFNAELDARVQLYLNDALQELNVDYWGDLFEKAQGLLTAHNLTVDNSNTAEGSISGSATTSEKAGDVSYTNDAGILAKQMESPYLRTSYGQEYLRLLRLLGAVAITV